MKKGLLYIGGISVLGYGIYKYFSTQAEILMNYDFKILGISIKKFKLDNISMDLKMRFISKSKIEAKVNSIYLDLFLEDKNVGYIKDVNSFIIPANGSSDITLFISINPQYLIKNITDIILGVGKSRDIKFKVDGYAEIKSGFFKSTLPIKYETTLKEYLKVIPTIS
jgi:hypothetical protein